MARQDYLFTSESVSEGHPDKVCDRISDEGVDLFFREGPKEGMSPWDIRAACETLATTNRVGIAGETRGPKSVGKEEVEAVARAAIKDIGYEQEGFHWQTAQVEILLHAQSPHIAQGVDASGNKDEGAGDQGIMFGYACRETPVLMPAPLHYSHKILQLLATARKSGKEKTLGADPKSQVTLHYAGGKPVEATQIVLSTQHMDEKQTSDDIRAIVEPYIRQALPADWITSKTVWHINPTGAFVVAAGLADRCTIQISYAIGVSDPLSVYVDTHGTGKVDETKLERVLPQLMSLKPRGIREHLGLNRPIYARTSAYGHFGREPDSEGGFSWEKTDLAEKLKGAV